MRLLLLLVLAMACLAACKKKDDDPKVDCKASSLQEAAAFGKYAVWYVHELDDTNHSDGYKQAEAEYQKASENLRNGTCPAIGASKCDTIAYNISDGQARRTQLLVWYKNTDQPIIDINADLEKLYHQRDSLHCQ